MSKRIFSSMDGEVSIGDRGNMSPFNNNNHKKGQFFSLKLLMCIILGTFLLTFGCKQRIANNGGKKNNPTQDNTETEITITVKGDAGLEIKKPDMFKVKKNSTWKEIKAIATEKIALKENQGIKEWKLKDGNGAVLKDADKFDKNETVFAVKKESIVKYTVEHWQENADDNEYSKVEKDTEEKTGEAGKNSDAKAKTYEGFTAQSFTQSLVKADGTTVIRINYNRKITSLTLNLNGGEAETKLEDETDGKKLLKGKYGARVEVKGLKREGWGFEKWEPALPQTFPIQDDTEHTYTAKWTEELVTITVQGDAGIALASPNTINVAKGAKWQDIKAQVMALASVKENFEIVSWKLDSESGIAIEENTEFTTNMTVFVTSKRQVVKYTVKHRKENVDNEEYTDWTSEAKEGEAGTSTEVVAKDEAGFEKPTPEQKTIKADGSTIVTLQYKRKITSLIIDLQGGNTTTKLDNENGKTLLKGKYGAKVEVKELKREGWGFEKWEPALPQTFPIQDDTEHTYTAKWTAELVTITVQGDAGIALASPNTINVAKGAKWQDIKTQVMALASAKENFEIVSCKLDSEVGIAIQENTEFTTNKTVFVTSKRQQITIKVEGDSGITLKGNDTITVDKGSKWGEIKGQAKDKIELDGNFQFQEWHLNNESGKVLQDEDIFSSNSTVFAVTKRKIVKYTVKHRKENVDNEEYTDWTSEEKEGEAGTQTEVVAKNEAGFEKPTPEQKTIKADGSTIVTLQYKRKITSLIIDLQGGSTETKLDDGTDGKKLLKGKYGASVSIKLPTKDKHRFEKWEPALPQTFPIQDDTGHTYTAKWKPVIMINIAGDERLEVTNPIYVDVNSFDGITWKDVKKQMEEKTVFKTGWSKDYYGIYDWKKEDDSLMEDNTAVTEGMKVCARTNYTKFKWDENKPTELIGYGEEKPRGKIIIPAKTTEMKNKIFKDCPEITDVDITECNELTSLDLRGTGIREIDLSVCPNLKEFHLNDCKNLEKVIATNLKEVTTLQDFFAGCTALKHIDLTGCDKLKTIGGLSWAHYQFKECTALETLNITGCTSLKKIELEGAKMKKIIGIQCQKAENIDISNCKNLEEIDLRSCDLLISQTSTEKKITKLNFSGSVNAIVTLPAFFLDSLPDGAFGIDANTYCKKVRVRGDFWKEKVKNTGYPEDRIERYNP